MIISDWAFRLLLAAGIIFLGWAGFQFTQQISLKRVKKYSHPFALEKPGKVTIVYFTTPDCVACKTAQRPALNRLQKMMEDQVQIVEINAYENPDMAKEWGVMSVPTTFILDSHGAPRHVNYGVTPVEKLAAQIRT
jgi:thiol-disulfide isomerase/thioredoxin